MKAFIQWADQKGVDLKIHKIVDAINEELLREQGIDDPEQAGLRKEF
jgi:hypothetical protein